MDQELFEKGERGKSLRIYLVNPPIADAWRTREDYINDRRSMEESFRRNAEQHELIKKSYRNNNISLVITFSIMIGTLLAAFVTFSNYLDAKMEPRTTSSDST